MKIIIFLTLFAMNFDWSFGRELETCDFVAELYKDHNVTQDDLFKHLCVVTSLHTDYNKHRFHHDHVGMYSIGTKWWCGMDGPGGSCNVSCAGLLDDDIADDVFCASLILSQQGTEAFGKSLERCVNEYKPIVDICISELDLLDEMANMPTITGDPSSISSSNTAPPVTTSQMTTASTPQTSTTTYAPSVRTTTFIPWIFRTKPPTSTSSTTSTIKQPSTTTISKTTTEIPSTTTVKSVVKTQENKDEEGSSFSIFGYFLLTIILVAGLVAGIIYTRKRYFNPTSYVRETSSEFSNQLMRDYVWFSVRKN